MIPDPLDTPLEVCQQRCAHYHQLQEAHTEAWRTIRDLQAQVEQANEQAAVLRNCFGNAEVAILHLCVLLGALDLRKTRLEAELALLQAALVWHDGTNPNELVKNYRAAHAITTGGNHESSTQSGA